MCNSGTAERTEAVSVGPMTVEQLIAQVKANRTNEIYELSLEESVFILPDVLELILATLLSEFNYQDHIKSEMGQACRTLATLSVHFQEKFKA